MLRLDETGLYRMLIDTFGPNAFRTYETATPYDVCDVRGNYHRRLQQMAIGKHMPAVSTCRILMTMQWSWRYG